MAAPTFVIDTFRGSFPEFKDKNKYTDEAITLWSTLAQQQVQQCRWKQSWLLGVSLYVAHELVLAARNQATAEVGGDPGQNPGIVASKTVGPISASYDRASTSEKNGGFWNLTNYGQQFLRLARIFGAGPVQVNNGFFLFGGFRGR